MSTLSTASSLTPPASAGTAPAWQFDHLNVVTNAHPQALAFFRDVMGLRNGDRPPFPFPGDWLYPADAGQGEACVHAVHAASAPLQGVDAPALRLHHLAFRTDEPAPAVLQRVLGCGLPHRISTLPGQPRMQIFVTLPGGLVMELVAPLATAAS
jgi:catechol 2,3-dioxygenase-like lactoylglutathione lyase family enzyme